MDRILQQVLINKDSIFDELNKYLENIDSDEIINILDSIKKETLYKSLFHGLHHSQKVCLFTYLICKQLQVNEVDTKILLDAAVYHDIGRQEDNEDTLHGWNSAMKIENVVDDPIYKDELNLLYLRAICDGHSLSDDRITTVFNNYSYENPELDMEKFKFLLSILKDADALDRTRFKKTSSAALKDSFLRLNYSKTLVEFATLLNEHYVFEVSKQDYESQKAQYETSEHNCSFFHGIGFDFFKLKSILNSGILSNFQATKEHVDIVRNFNGNNKNIWISVVESESVPKDGKAYRCFIKEGISFYAFASKLCKGSTKDVDDYNTAHNSQEYNDESFAFNKIPLNDIHSIIIFKENWNKNINELFYLYGNNNYDIVYGKVMNYMVHIREELGLQVDFGRAEKLLAEYRIKVIDFENLQNHEQRKDFNKFIASLDELRNELNKEVQKWFLQYYQSLLNTNSVDIKVSDVVKLILTTSKVNVSDVYDNDDEIMIVLNPLLLEMNTDKEKGVKK